MSGKQIERLPRHCGIGLALAALIAVQAGAVEVATAQEFRVPSDANQYILDQTLAYRASKGVQKVWVKGAPNRAADKYARFLAENNLSGHTADGRQPGDRVKAEGGKFCGVSENVHESWSSPSPASWQDAMQQAMNFWKTSPGHEANLRRAEADQMGIGVHGWKHGDRYYYKSVQVFLQTKC
jgi:uncharacterized protein YkwD